MVTSLFAMLGVHGPQNKDKNKTIAPLVFQSLGHFKRVGHEARGRSKEQGRLCLLLEL